MADRPHRLSPVQAELAAVLGPLDGARIPGGCEDCDAYQVVEPVAAGVWNILVHHDDWCPTYRRMKGAHL
jgi:hypothetical protein